MTETQPAILTPASCGGIVVRYQDSPTAQHFTAGEWAALLAAVRDLGSPGEAAATPAAAAV